MSELYSTAVEAVYDALVSTGRWGSALAAVAEFVGARAGLLFFADGEDLVLPLGVLGFDQASLAGGSELRRIAFAGESLLVDCPTGATLTLAFAPGSTTSPASALLRLAGDRGLGTALGSALLRDGSFTASLWLFREPAQRFDAGACTRLRQVIGHLQRALSVQRRIEQTETRADASWQAFERVVLGAVVVDKEARPLLVNRAAKRIAAEGDGFAIGDEGVAGLSSDDTRALHAAISKVARGRAPGGLALALPRRCGSRPYEVMVVPVRRSPWSLFGQRGAAIVFISDWAGTSASVAGFVRELYGLTAAETRLALLLLGGQGLAEAAEVLGVTRNTAHTQLSSIFRKTHTSSQAELVRALLSGPGAIRPPGDSSIGHRPVN